MDDVFSGVDNTNVALICERLFGPLGLLRADETTVVMATHSSKYSFKAIYRRIRCTWLPFADDVC